MGCNIRNANANRDAKETRIFMNPATRISSRVTISLTDQSRHLAYGSYTQIIQEPHQRNHDIIVVSSLNLLRIKLWLMII